MGDYDVAERMKTDRSMLDIQTPQKSMLDDSNIDLGQCKNESRIIYNVTA